LEKENPVFEIVDVKGDGHCLFRALASLLYGDEKYFSKLKVAIKAHWIANSNTLLTV
jgi:hypothetical protein